MQLEVSTIKGAVKGIHAAVISTYHWFPVVEVQNHAVDLRLGVPEQGAVRVVGTALLHGIGLIAYKVSKTIIDAVFVSCVPSSF